MSDATGPRRQGRAARVAAELRAWIGDEGPGPGQRLPDTADLMVRLGASKGALQAALRQLQAEGLLVRRRGRDAGLYVSDLSEARLRSVLAGLDFFRDVSASDIFDLRRMVEPEVAATLAGRLPEEALDALEALIPGAEAGPGCDRTGLAFHARLARESGNPLVVFLVAFVADLMAGLPALPDPDVVYQRRLVAALRDGDPRMARRILRDHLEAEGHRVTAPLRLIAE